MPADACRMTVTLRSGEQIVRTVEHATGSTSAPMTADQLEAKVARLVGHLDDPGRLWNTAWRLDEVSDVSELFESAAR